MRNARFFMKLIAFVCLLCMLVNALGTLLDGGDDIMQSSSALRHLPRNSADVLWLGTSHMNYNVIPQLLFDEYGVTSAMATGNSVDFDQSYWALRHALRRQKPQVVVLDVYPAAAPYCYFYVQNVLAMEYRDGMSGGSNPYNTVSGTARWLPAGSLNKAGAIWEAWRKSGIDGDAYFQLTRLHSRYGELTRTNYEYTAGQSRYIRNFGYRYSHTVLDDYDVEPYDLSSAMAANEVGTFWTFTDEQLAEVQLLPDVVSSLRRIADYTRKKGIQLVLCAAPYMTNAAEEKLFAQVGELAGEWGVPFVALDASGLEAISFMRDLGHLNDDGAQAYTRFFGEYLTGHYPLTDRRESADERYAPWMDHMGSHQEQHTAMHLSQYEGNPTGYLELVSSLGEDYLTLITIDGYAYEGFTEDDYDILAEEMGAECEAMEEWYYNGCGTLDLALCGGKLLFSNYEPDGRQYTLHRNALGHDIQLLYNGSLRAQVDGNSLGKAEEGMTVAVYSRLDHMLMETRTFDMSTYYFDEEDDW